MGKNARGYPLRRQGSATRTAQTYCKKTFREYNRTTEEDMPKKKEIMQKLFRSVGENVFIEPDFICEFGSNITIGNNVFINFGCIIFDCGEVTIGDNTMFGPRAGIYTTNHALNAEERIKNICISKPINIGKRVWLGADVKIIQGVTIGDDTVIGAGSVVTKSIPSGVVAVGNPCKVLRKITEKDKLIK